MGQMNGRASVPIRTFPAKHRSKRGFALLEILVAFVVLALGLGAISTGVAVAMRSDGRVHTMQIMQRLAQSRLEEAGISETLVPGYREGRIGKIYRWQETITAVPIGAKLPKLQDAKLSQPSVVAGISSYWVEVAVHAGDGAVSRLAALKLVFEIKQ
jgi:general secretion pathway protein I